MDAKHIPQEILLGERICRKLKSIFYPDKIWHECYEDLGNKFSELKRSFPTTTYKEKMELLEILASMDLGEIEEILKSQCSTQNNKDNK